MSMAPVQEDRRPTALLVADDGIIRMEAARILEDAGFVTLEAIDGDEAVDVLEQHGADVTLPFSDIEMPGSRNGFALAREVAAQWPHVAIAIASGHLQPGPDDMPEGARFIGKPFSAEMVHGHVREIVPYQRKPKPLRS